MDVALYIGLTVACLLIGSVGFFLARLVQRKGRDHSLYSMARSGELFIGFTFAQPSFVMCLRANYKELWKYWKKKVREREKSVNEGGDLRGLVLFDFQGSKWGRNDEKFRQLDVIRQH